MAPKVSIIVPTYNRLAYLQSCLKSVAKQSLENWECLIIDDGSTDGTQSFLKDLTKKDGRFKCFFRPQYYPKGAASCRNFGLIQSKGEFIQWLDDDDLLSRDKLKFQVNRLENMKDEDCITTCSWDLYWPNKKLELKSLISDGEFLDSRSFFEKLYAKQTFVPASAYLVPRSVAFAAGMWNQSLTLNDDAEYFTRILLNANKLVMTNDCYVLYREHSNERISSRKDENSLRSFLLSLHLIHSHLISRDIRVPYYFKWKLKKIFRQYSKTSMGVLKSHYYFFRENGIDLRFSGLLRLRIYMFKVFYPIYKELTKTKAH